MPAALTKTKGLKYQILGKNTSVFYKRHDTRYSDVLLYVVTPYSMVGKPDVSENPLYLH